MTDYNSSSLFDSWIKAKRTKLFRLALSVLKDTAEAEDLVQDVLVILWRKSAQEKIKNIDAYAERSVWVNAIKRRSRRRDMVSLDQHNSERSKVHDISEDLDLTPWELELAVSKLPTAQQTVIRLRYYSDISFKEIGTSLSISINTAASRCRYALKALRDALSAAKKELHHGKR